MENRLRDKIAGAIIGYAIGDAIGLSTEFMTHEEAEALYPHGIENYNDILTDAHRAQWGPGHYTHVTIFVLMLAENILRDKKLDPLAFAKSMSDWYGEGHYDVPTQFRAVLSNPDYESQPYVVAKETSQRMGHNSETGSVLGMAHLAGIVGTDNPIEAADLCRTLETGPLAIASSVATAHTSYSLLWKDHTPDAEELKHVTKACGGNLDSSINAASSPNGIAALEVDDEDELWLASKCLGAALWAIWNFDSFEEGIQHVTMLGGESDINSALAGGWLGIRYGLEGIPDRWKKGLYNYAYVEDVALRLADFLIANRKI